mmetsp:Transcript_68158/g.108134  ORF Transcript_68158/g.108134 Transcript_68158/m.108134 type:complete len:85 (-) Transcript_68158:134-388(-)
MESIGEEPSDFGKVMRPGETGRQGSRLSLVHHFLCVNVLHADWSVCLPRLPPHLPARRPRCALVIFTERASFPGSTPRASPGVE